MAANRLCASVTLMFTERPFLERFDAARAAGFEAVEIQNLAEADPRESARAAEQAGVDVILVNAGMGDLREGGLGLSGVPGRSERFERELGSTLDAAQILGAGLVHVGPSRVPPGADRAPSLAAYRANLEQATRLAEGTGVELTIEPLNRVELPDILLSDLAEASAIVAALGAPLLGVQLDVYHLTLNGLDPTPLFQSHCPLVKHVQFSDAPGRHEPGSGTIDFDRFLTAVAASDYRGWLGAEYHPSGPTEATLGWIPEFRSRLG